MASLDHVTIRVSDLAASQAFYDTVLAPLGLVDPYVADGFVEWGDFSIAAPAKGRPVTSGLHVAFAAGSREQVDAFHAAAVAAGYASNGAPGERSEYHPGYYGAYVLDPDGHNVEAVFHDRTATTVPRALSLATDIDVLPVDRIVERRDGYLLVRSPRNPVHYWGNLLSSTARRPRATPSAGRRSSRWSSATSRACATAPSPGIAPTAPPARRARSSARAAMTWWRRSASSPRPVSSCRIHARTATSSFARSTPSQAPTTSCGRRSSSSRSPVARRGTPRPTTAPFTRARLARPAGALSRRTRGLVRGARSRTGTVAASCGVVVTAGRGRFQVVDTALAYRRRGIASRLVVEAARRASEDYGAAQFVIVAEAGYHALGLYESLGFVRREQVVGVCFWERAAT